MEIDDLFPVAETLQLLRFAEVAEGDIRLTDAGRRFADAEPRRRASGCSPSICWPTCRSPPTSAACSTSAPAIARRRAASATSSRTTCREEDAEQTLRAVIIWGRYAEIFAYDDDSGVFSLENPATIAS